MKDVKEINELEEKILCWQPNSSLNKKFKENPKFTPQEIQNLIEELTLRRIESVELQDLKLELEESRRQYQELYDFYPDGFLILDETNVIKEANLVISSQLDQKPESLVGRNFLLSFIAPESQEAFNSFLVNIFQSRRKYSCEILLQKKPEQTIPVLLTGCVRKDAQGQFEIHILISMNQKSSENQNSPPAVVDIEQTSKHVTSEHRRNPLVIVDMEGTLIFVNSEFSRTTGYSQRELLNQSVADFIFEDDRYKIMSKLLKARIGLPVDPKIKFRVTCKNQDYVSFYCRPQPLIMAGQTQGFVAVLFKTLNTSQSDGKTESKEPCLQTS